MITALMRFSDPQNTSRSMYLDYSIYFMARKQSQ